jgi:hypothetical protein
VDERGQNLPGYSSGQVQPKSGRWWSLTLGLTLPDAIGGSKMVKLRIVPIVDGFQEGGQVYFDDVGLHRLD